MNKKPQHDKPKEYSDYVDDMVDKGEWTKKEGEKNKKDAKRKSYQSVYNSGI